MPGTVQSSIGKKKKQQGLCGTNYKGLMYKELSPQEREEKNVIPEQCLKRY